MNFLHGITLLLSFQLLGELGVQLAGLPIPGPVLGMLLLLLALLWRGRPSPALDDASSALLNHLSLLFVPAGVGMMVHLEQIGHEWLPIVLALILSTIITMLATAAIMLGLNRLLNLRSGRHG